MFVVPTLLQAYPNEWQEIRLLSVIIAEPLSEALFAVLEPPDDVSEPDVADEPMLASAPDEVAFDLLADELVILLYILTLLLL